MKPWRRRTVKALIVLGALFAFLSVFSIWVERQALNTDDWVTTSGKLLDNSTIRSALADYLVNQLYENVNVQKELKEILLSVNSGLEQKEILPLSRYHLE